LDVAQRLEAGTEPRFRSPHSLCDRADPPAVEGVDVKDAIRLAEAEGPKHDRLRLVGAPGHSDKSRAAVARPLLDAGRGNGDPADADLTPGSAGSNTCRGPRRVSSRSASGSEDTAP